MGTANGNGHGNGAHGHGNGGGNGGEARERKPLPPGAEALGEQMREGFDRQLETVRNIALVAETASEQYLAELTKLGNGITERLRQQDDDIAELRRRLDAVEARQAEAGKAAP